MDKVDAVQEVVVAALYTCGRKEKTPLHHNSNQGEEAELKHQHGGHRQGVTLNMM